MILYDCVPCYVCSEFLEDVEPKVKSWMLNFWKYFSRMFSDDYDPSDIPPDQAGYSYPVPANPLELPSME